jgi:serine/threonine protein kinase
MKICPSCQAKFDDDAVVCGHCGARLMLDTSETMPDPKHLLVGKVLGGNYKVERLLGQGGMGMVFESRQLSLDRRVAVKVLLAPLAMDREIVERFQREAKAASNIGHSGIVQVIDMGYMKEGPPFMVMELLQGEDLRMRLKRDGAMDAPEAIPIVLQLCDALQAAHDMGIVHRDLKPDNIFLVPRKGKGPVAKILDFGLSKLKSADRTLTATGSLIGTPNYMAPEQISGEDEVDARTDIYALGAIFYEMVTGRMAYEGRTVQSIFFKIMSEAPPPPRALRPDIPEGVEAVIFKAMSRDPASRFGTISEMAESLVRVGSDMGIPRSQMSVLPSAEGLGRGQGSGQGQGPGGYMPPSPPPGYGQGQQASLQGYPAGSGYPYGPPPAGPPPGPPTGYPYQAQGRPVLPAKPSRGTGQGILIGIVITIVVVFVLIVVGVFSCSIIMRSCAQGCAQGFQDMVDGMTFDVNVSDAWVEEEFEEEYEEPSW